MVRNKRILSVDNTLHTILTVHTSVVPVTSCVPDHHHLYLDSMGHYNDTTSSLIQ